MQDLHELAQIVTRNKLRDIELISTPEAGNSSKLWEFYEALQDNKFVTDEDASLYFYNSTDSNSSYRKLRNNLKNRLINSVFFINVKQASYTDRERAYYECYKDWAAAKILFAKDARVSGIGLCHKLLNLAIKFEFTDLALDVARMLRLHYGTMEGDIKKMDYYHEICLKYEDIWQKEGLAEWLYIDLVSRYVHNKATKGKIHQAAKKSYAQLKDALEKYDTYKLQLCGILLQTIVYTSIHDYKNTIQVCEKAIRFFESKDYNVNASMQIFLHQLMVCHTQLKQYAEGKAIAEKCLAISEEGTFNWFKNQELYLLLSMHTAAYQQAYRIFNEAVNNNRFRFLPQVIQETWKIYEAYIHYLIDVGRITMDADDTRFNKFRLGKFINDTPIFSKDKRGMNIPILVIQILFMILQQKFDAAIDSIEAIEKYCSRHLKKDDTYRSNCFIKMLLQIPISNFHRAAVERKAAKFLEGLLSTPLEVANQTHEIEIIPYQDLWQLALETMDNKFHRVTSRKKAVQKEA